MSESQKESHLDLPIGNQPNSDQLDSQVQRAQEQLLQLKRQQDAIEKQKRELEELSRKQDELEKGRAEMIDKLTRSMVVMERETYEAERRVEQFRSSSTSFSQHLRVLERINPKSWNNADLHKELSKALSAVDDARTEHNKNLTKINAEGEGEVIDPLTPTEYSEYSGSEDQQFMVWFKRGFAFTLPLLIFGVIAVAAVLIVHSLTK